MRLALISTPRSGNTWVRRTLAESLKLKELAVHNFQDLPATLPERTILQLHWYREPNFQAYLARNGFKVITLARHPLDVLVSAAHFIRNDDSPARWLEGNTLIAGSLTGSAPASAEFLDWALGWGAENLLSVSYQWWHDPEAAKLRYEDLLEAPLEVFSKLYRDLGPDLEAEAGEAAQLSVSPAAFTLLSERENHHAWQGKSGTWRRLIPYMDARKIRSRHRRVFDVLGYRIAPHPLLRGQALRNWESMKR